MLLHQSNGLSRKTIYVEDRGWHFLKTFRKTTIFINLRVLLRFMSYLTYLKDRAISVAFFVPGIFLAIIGLLMFITSTNTLSTIFAIILLMIGGGLLLGTRYFGNTQNH